tara:strand:- start:68 stop:508 length:441 start_codon:yes stop_codon:yes gene_type:complete
LSSGIIAEGNKTGIRHLPADPRIHPLQHQFDWLTLTALDSFPLVDLQPIVAFPLSVYGQTVNSAFRAEAASAFSVFSEDAAVVMTVPLWHAYPVWDNRLQGDPIVVHHTDCRVQPDAQSCPALWLPASDGEKQAVTLELASSAAVD